jgi:hypothetical protein
MVKHPYWTLFNFPFLYKTYIFYEILGFPRGRSVHFYYFSSLSQS